MDLCHRLARTRQQADQQAEDAVIEGKIQAEKKQQPQRRPACPRRRTGAWCCRSSSRFRHTRECRRHRPEEKPDPGFAGSSLTPARSCRVSGSPGPQKRDQQGSDGHPAQKIQIGQGENQNLQAGRQQGQQPRALVHSQHAASITKCGPQTQTHVGPQPTSDCHGPRMPTLSLSSRRV